METKILSLVLFFSVFSPSILSCVGHSFRLNCFLFDWNGSLVVTRFHLNVVSLSLSLSLLPFVSFDLFDSWNWGTGRRRRNDRRDYYTVFRNKSRDTRVGLLVHQMHFMSLWMSFIYCSFLSHSLSSILLKDLSTFVISESLDCRDDSWLDWCNNAWLSITLAISISV